MLNEKSAKCWVRTKNTLIHEGYVSTLPVGDLHFEMAVRVLAFIQLCGLLFGKQKEKKKKKKPLDRSLAENCSYALEFDRNWNSQECPGWFIKTLNWVSSKVQKIPGLETLASGVKTLYFLRNGALQHVILSAFIVKCYMVQLWVPNANFHVGLETVLTTVDMTHGNIRRWTNNYVFSNQTTSTVIPSTILSSKLANWCCEKLIITNRPTRSIHHQHWFYINSITLKRGLKHNT